MSNPYAHDTTEYYAFQAGAASRDAEIARLKSVPMKYRRMEFNAQLQTENDQLREQVAMLRDTLKETVAALEHRWEVIANRSAPVMESVIDAAHTRGIKALAATEPKS